ncbi:MAG: HAD family phosphatase [Muribaculaceae bacterium]|nr:HAD family phosphatase [Muribaculaceae bacterium]
MNIGFLFDLDGVLIDSEKEYSRIWSKINSEFPTGIENLEDKIKGSTLTKILTEYYDSEEIREKVAKRLHELENRMKYNYLPYAENFLLELKRRNIPCVLVTSSDDEKMNHLWLQIPRLKDFFSSIVTGNQVKTSKPSPEGYLTGAASICANPSNCVVFEDSLQGVMAGNNSGAFVVGVAGTLPAESLAPYSHLVINNFNEIDIDDLIQILSER